MKLFTLLIASTLLGCASNEPMYLIGQSETPQSRITAQDALRESILHDTKLAALDSPLKAITTPLPDYPIALRRANITGTVRVRFDIEKTGKVSNTTVLGSPEAALAELAVHTLQGWRFEPPKCGGTAVTVRTEQVFNFTIQ